MSMRSVSVLARLATCIALGHVAACGVFTSKAEFDAYEGVALQPDAERRIAMASEYHRAFADGFYEERVAAAAREAEPLVGRIRAQRLAEQQHQNQAAEHVRRSAEELRRAEQQAQRQELERQAAAQRETAAMASLARLREEVRSLANFGSWDEASAALMTWTEEFGGTNTAAGAARELRREVERGAAFASAISASRAQRVRLPLRRFVKQANTPPRGLPEVDSALPPGVIPLGFGAAVDVWYTAPGGWVLVAPAEAAAEAGVLTSMTGWLRTEEITQRDVATEERRRLEAQALADDRRRELEEARARRRAELAARAAARRDSARQGGETQGDNDLAAYMCYRNCVSEACPEVLQCIQGCAESVRCIDAGGVGACWDRYRPCSESCRSRCRTRP